MQKVFSKISPGIISVLMIVAILVTLSPLATMMAFLQEIKPPLFHHPAKVQIVVPEPIEHFKYVVPKPSRELVFSFFKKHWAGLFSSIDCFALFAKAQTCAEGHKYFYNNDVHFNIPTITYRQPASEHSSEG